MIIISLEKRLKELEIRGKNRNPSDCSVELQDDAEVKNSK